MDSGAFWQLQIMYRTPAAEKNIQTGSDAAEARVYLFSHWYSLWRQRVRLYQHWPLADLVAASTTSLLTINLPSYSMFYPRQAVR